MVVAVVLQPPPVTELESKIFTPGQVGTLPAIAGGKGLTVIVRIAVHPTPNVYVITDVPNEIPDTTPPVSILATDTLLLVHVPPAVALVSEPVVPKHTDADPAIAAGNACTVNERLTEQPVESV
jgi:hypothetical protein